MRPSVLTLVVLEHGGDLLAGLVGAAEGDHVDVRPEGRQIGRDATGAAQPRFFALEVQDGDRGVVAEAFGVAVDVLSSIKSPIRTILAAGRCSTSSINRVGILTGIVRNFGRMVLSKG